MIEFSMLPRILSDADQRARDLARRTGQRVEVIALDGLSSPVVRVADSPPRRASFSGHAAAGSVIRGYGAVFGALSNPLPGGYREQVRYGAFARSLASGREIRALWRHDRSRVLGTTRDGSLFLVESDRGLYFELLNAPADIVRAVRNGEFSTCSFGFTDAQVRWRQVGDMRLRELVEVDLQEISLLPAGNAAYPATYARATVPVETLRRELELLETTI